MSITTVDEQTNLIRARYLRVLERIRRAAMRGGRRPDDVRVVVVSKAQPVEVIQRAIQAGIRVFGENYPEEAAPKIAAIDEPGVEWHMIGHLQSRKAKIVAEQFHWFHALDSLKLAEKLNRELVERNRRMPVLLEFNVGGEESKAGWMAADESTWPRLADEIATLLDYPSLDIRGLMTMPPLELEPEKAREHFIKIRRLRDFFWARFAPAIWTELSMGTSLDFEAAVEEGATMVRIGQAILGPRPLKL